LSTCFFPPPSTGSKLLIARSLVKDRIAILGHNIPDRLASAYRVSGFSKEFIKTHVQKRQQAILYGTASRLRHAIRDLLGELVKTDDKNFTHVAVADEDLPWAKADAEEAKAKKRATDRGKGEEAKLVIEDWEPCTQRWANAIGSRI
jgi:hypothetical protein